MSSPLDLLGWGAAVAIVVILLGIATAIAYAFIESVR